MTFSFSSGDFNPIELCFGWVKRSIIGWGPDLHEAVDMGASFPDVVLDTFLDMPPEIFPGFYSHSLQSCGH